MQHLLQCVDYSISFIQIKITSLHSIPTEGGLEYTDISAAVLLFLGGSGWYDNEEDKYVGRQHSNSLHRDIIITLLCGKKSVLAKDRKLL